MRESAPPMLASDVTHGNPLRAPRRRRPLPGWLALGLLGAANLVLCVLGRTLTPGVDRVAVYWPAIGLATAVLLRSPPARWPAQLAAMAVTTLAFNALGGHAPVVFVALTVSNVVAAPLGAFVTRALCGGPPALGDQRHVLAFVVGGPLVAGSLNVLPAAALWWAAGAPFGVVWTALWVGSALGLLTAGGLILAWSEQPEPHEPPRRHAVLELAGLAVAFAASACVGLVSPRAPGTEILVLPVLVWAALRYGPRGATTVGLATTAVALTVTIRERGAFALEPGTVEAHAVAAQLFCGVAVVTMLFMASAVEGRRRAAAALRATHERLRRSEKLEGIGRLAGGVAHDFNNQLTGILGGADYLADALRDRPALREVALEIVAAAQRSARLTRQLLAFARKQPPAGGGVDVHATIRDVVALLSRTVDKRVAVSTDLRAPAPLVIGDGDRLHGALLNLAVNACDAMPGGGALGIETSGVALDREACAALGFELSPGDYLRVAVRDTGLGMGPEARAHLFEPFFTTKPAGRGTGLGLAEVYGTVAAHRGAITVETAPGRGTTVVLLLPLAPAVPAAVEAGAPPDAIAPASRRCILVVDDEPAVRRSLARLLRASGHDAVECESGRAALDQLAVRGDEVDLAIVDMMMPDMSGREVVARLRGSRAELPIVVSSGYSDSADLDELRPLARVFLLPKPYAADELERAIAVAAAARDERPAAVDI